MSRPRPEGLRVAFRADASIEIGTGHVMRCLTLADALIREGATCLFICRAMPGDLRKAIAQRGHATRPLPAAEALPAQDASGPAHAHWLGVTWTQDARETRAAIGPTPVDWLVVDHYALDGRWEEALRPSCRHLMVIDDLADRTHACDLLLDQNTGRRAQDYAALLPIDTPVLAGPRYALLRPEFAALRAESLTRRRQPRLGRLLVTMGGIDKDNVTERVLDALDACPMPRDLEITVVLGPQAPWRAQVEARAARMCNATHVRVGVADMARLMTDSDLAIGAAGSTSWERCALGLPSIVLVLAENQRSIAESLHQQEASVAVSSSGEAAACIEHHLQDDTLVPFLQRLSRGGAAIADGEGAARVVRGMVQHG